MAPTSTTMSTIQTLKERILDFRDRRNWAQFHKPKDVVLSLMLEAAELAEHFQWKSEEEIQTHVQEQREAIGDELSDVLYWVLLLSHDLGIDIEQAFNRKMDKNEEKYPVEKSKGRHTKYSEL